MYIYLSTMPRRRMRRATGRGSGKKLSKRQIRQVKKLITVDKEMKIFDTVSSGMSVNSGGTISGPYTSIGQGQAEAQRLADEIRIRSIEVRSNLIAGDSTNILRMIWFQWYQNNATATPTIGAILQNGTYWLSPINETNERARLFRVMFDRTYALSTTGSNQSISVVKKFYGKKIPRKNLEYNPTATTGFCQVYCLLVSDSIAAPNPSVSIVTRVNYVDS